MERRFDFQFCLMPGHLFLYLYLFLVDDQELIKRKSTEWTCPLFTADSLSIEDRLLFLLICGAPPDI